MAAFSFSTLSLIYPYHWKSQGCQKRLLVYNPPIRFSNEPS